MITFEGLDFHHVGVACRDIERELDYYRLFGYEVESERFSDASQGISGLFLTGGGPRLELLEPLGDSDTLTPWIESGVRMYHLGYTCGEIETSAEMLKSKRAKCVREPLPAVAFDGALVAFFMMPNRALFELIEMRP